MNASQLKSNRGQQIASIIEKRRPLATKIEGVSANLALLMEALGQLDRERDGLMEGAEEPEVIGRLKDIDTSPIRSRIARELVALDRLKARFSRPTLNIGVVGRARQGKSRLLQSLTGLTSAEIPDGANQHCTGVRSTIYHNPAFETSAEVWFQTERSFLDEVIAPYYQKLGLGAKPLTLEQFANNPPPPLAQNIAGAETGAQYEHLLQYRTHLDKYRHLLREPSPRRITKAEIREYVAQDNLAGERLYHNYLAVREVKIFCDFPNAEVGQIALVDLPGLGDTGIGDEERLVKTVGKDIDAVLFVRMPKTSGDFLGDVDVRLYDIAYNALVDLPLEEWSFMVFNRTEDSSNLGDNSVLCQQLASELANKHINVSQYTIANCADPVDANTKVLDAVLDYLAAKITSLDGFYASSCQERLQQIYQQIQQVLTKAENVFPLKTGSSAESGQFEVLFEKLWENVAYGLEELLRELAKQTEKEDSDFKESVERAIRACKEDTGLPSSVEEVRKRQAGSSGPRGAYEQYLNEIRARLSQKFLSLDDGLKYSVDKVKSQVTDVLIERGRLGGLTEAKGAEFIGAIASLLPEQLLPDGPSKLKYGFQILAEFQLSYRGFVQHRIRECLDDLTPLRTSIEPLEKPEEVMQVLRVLQKEAVYKCQEALEGLLPEPSVAGFAIVEEFLDRVLRAKTVKSEWRVLLADRRATVWPEEFKLLAERAQMRQEWQAVVGRVVAASQSESLQFLN